MAICALMHEHDLQYGSHLLKTRPLIFRASRWIEYLKRGQKEQQWASASKPTSLDQSYQNSSHLMKLSRMEMIIRHPDVPPCAYKTHRISSISG